MNLLNVADILADVLKIESVTAGNIDQNRECCIGVYNTKNSRPHRICIGGKACTKTLEKQISILIHWTDSPVVCEDKAAEIFDTLTDVREHQAKNYKVHYIKCNDFVPVGRDDRGIYEYVIEAIIYYERTE